MMHRQIENRLRSLGLSAVYQGYTCLVHAAALAIEEPHRLTLVTKWIYPDVSKLCGLTPGQVDSTIRAAIRLCFRRCGAEVTRMCGIVGEPSVTQFLTGLTMWAQEGSLR